MTILCPCCQRPVEAPQLPLEMLKHIPVTVTARTIIARLAAAHPNPVGTEALIDLVYTGARLPSDPAKSMREHIARVRRLLVDCGWTVANVAGRGQGVTGEYRLAPLEDA